MRGRKCRRKKGITLIELLIVVGVIALLLAILIPALQVAKARAGGVICMSNLRQWDLCYYLYTQDYDGQFPIFIWDDPDNSTFMENYREYYNDIDKMRFCPVAKRYIPGVNPIDVNRELGMTFAPWWINPEEVIWMNPDDCGLSNYGENSWIRSGMELDQEKLWRKIDCVKNSSIVPFIGDARWCNALPDYSQPLPVPVLTEQQFYYAGIWRYAECFAMRRHKDGSNLAFSDSSIRRISPESIWSLKWHATYLPRTNVDLSWMNF